MSKTDTTQNDAVVTASARSLITPTIKALILEKTPKEYIKTRPGRGGRQLSYVTTGYIIKRLNEVFNYLWSFEVVEDKIGADQVYVKGKLTAHLSPDLTITKTQYGGKDIAKNQSGKAIDIGDDMKAAASDSLKKCASLFGISSDVFWPDGEVEEEIEAAERPNGPEEDTEEPQRVARVPMITRNQKLEIITLLGKKGKTTTDLLKAIEPFGAGSYQELNTRQAEHLLTKMRSLPNKSENGGE